MVRGLIYFFFIAQLMNADAAVLINHRDKRVTDKIRKNICLNAEFETSILPLALILHEDVDTVKVIVKTDTVELNGGTKSLFVGHREKFYVVGSKPGDYEIIVTNKNDTSEVYLTISGTVFKFKFREIMIEEDLPGFKLGEKFTRHKDSFSLETGIINTADDGLNYGQSKLRRLISVVTEPENSFSGDVLAQAEYDVWFFYRCEMFRGINQDWLKLDRSVKIPTLYGTIIIGEEKYDYNGQNAVVKFQASSKTFKQFYSLLDDEINSNSIKPPPNLLGRNRSYNKIIAPRLTTDTLKFAVKDNDNTHSQETRLEIYDQIFLFAFSNNSRPGLKENVTESRNLLTTTGIQHASIAGEDDERVYHESDKIFNILAN